VTKAHEELKRLVRSSQQKRQLRELLGMTQQALSNIMTGRSRPNVERMATIERHLGIPMAWWAQEAPRRRVSRSASVALSDESADGVRCA
jgi:transcriptional regulator with XRE-family HTH domain